MKFAFARVGAAVSMRVEDYYPEGKRWWVRLHAKGGKRHEMPAHHNLEAYLDAYIDAAGICGAGKTPHGRADRQGDASDGRIPDDTAPRGRTRPRGEDWLPHLPG